MSAGHSGAERRILLVDDDAVFTSVMARGFERRGFQCLECHSARTALEACAWFAPSHILLDLNMPRKDGREVICDLKADPGLRQIPIVVLTTTQAEEDVWRAYDLGVNSFIVKPVVFEALVDVVSTLGRYWFGTVELPGSRGR